MNDIVNNKNHKNHIMNDKKCHNIVDDKQLWS